MIEITSNVRQDLAFVTGQKDGEPTVEIIKGGETRTVALDADHPEVAARVFAGAITVSPIKRSRERAADEPSS